MAIPKTPPNWADMTPAQRDRWWHDNVYRGDMPQLTWRAGVTGAVVGALLSLVNLYIGIKTGFAVGMGVTSVVLSYGAFRLLSKLGITEEITVLENNAVQSTATAAGYMTGMVTSSLAAYMMVTNQVFPMWQAIIWAGTLAILGVLFAFPWKQRFINSGEYPFPEGAAAAVVMDGIHSDSPADRIKTTILARGGIAAGIWAIFTSSKWAFLPETLFGWLPKIGGVAVQSWSVDVALDGALIGIGGIVGLRIALSWLLGAVLNYLVFVPVLYHFDMIAIAHPDTGLGYRDIVAWSMWPGVAMVTAASLYSFPGMIKSSLATLGSGKSESSVLKDVELPMPVFYVGIPLVSAAVIMMGHSFFGISILMGSGSILLIAIFTLIAVNSTALTSYTPSSALAKLSQVYAAALSPGNAGINLATGSIAAEVTSNAANLLMDIRAGWLLGAKPRDQAKAHIIGAIVGAWAATSVFYSLFHGDIKVLGSDAMPLPSAIVWKGLAEVLNKGISAVPMSARWAMLVGVLVGLGLEWLNARWNKAYKQPFPITPIGLSLGFIVQFFVAGAVALGAIMFWLGDNAGKKNKGGWFDRVITMDEGVTLASSLIAGAGLAGLLIMMYGVLS